MGYSQAMLDKPVVGIADTGSDFNNCHRTAPELVEAVKRGVLAAGGLPLAFPTVSLCEPSLSPCSMHYRNLMALDTEAMLAAQPMDAAVLVGGCDKTVPAQLMAAVSAGTPSVMLVTGPMLAQAFEGERLSACTDCRRYWARYRAGEVARERIDEIEGKLATTAGTCGVMGTASTMACIAATLGFMPLPAASAPAVHADRLRMAEEAGAQAVRLISRPVPPAALVTAESVENAARVLLALGGSTNAVVHLAAIAGRAGVPVDLRRLDHLSEETPGAGGPEADRRRLHGGLPRRRRHARLAARAARPPAPRLPRPRRPDAARAPGRRPDLRRPRRHPRPRRAGQPRRRPGVAVRLPRPGRRHPQAQRRHAVAVRDGSPLRRLRRLEDLANRVDDDALDVTPSDIMVLKNAGPLTPGGMPEAGYLPIPKKLARAGVKDMVRISDCRMSGTAFGTIVLHVAPEAAVGGPLALAETATGSACR
jgi:dihydroxy-acid dehydratase